MYHRISDVEMFNTHIGYISQNYPVVIPGDALPQGKLSVCLTFDDAYFDSYHSVFPILEKLQIRAVIGVPARFIMEDTSVDKKIRLNVPYDDAMKSNVFIEKAPFCTWQELKEMADSGLVRVASHSNSHMNLIRGNVDLTDEIVLSKQIIEQRLSQEIDTFIYPFGKVDRRVHHFASGHYKYLMRIGSALNKDWHNSNNMIYRVNGDNLMGRKGFGKINILKYFLKYISNTIRRK